MYRFQTALCVLEEMERMSVASAPATMVGTASSVSVTTRLCPVKSQMPSVFGEIYLLCESCIQFM